LILSTSPLSEPLAAEPIEERIPKDHEEALLGVKRDDGLGEEGEEDRNWREEFRVEEGGRRGVGGPEELRGLEEGLAVVRGRIMWVK